MGVLVSQNNERMETCNTLKVILIFLSIAVMYCYLRITTPIPVEIRVENPQFDLLGPYNTTDYEFEDIYEQLIDIKNFTFKVNPQTCRDYNAGLLLLIMVASHPSNFVKRSTIRSTWGRTNDYTKVVFLMGELDSPVYSRYLQNESVLHGDIVQGNFKDAYRNMTYKHVMGLKWVAHHCPMAKYVLKTDDDIVVNSQALRKFLVRQLSPWGSRGLITCQVLEHAKVLRNNSKWMVTKSEYADAYYPNYCAGYAILYSQDVIPKLLETAQTTPYFWIDDVHITGVIAQKTGVTCTPLKTLILNRHRMHMLTSFGPQYAGNFLFGPPDLSVEKVSKVWKALAA